MENSERKDLLQMETDLQGHINLHVRDDEGSRNSGFVPNTPDASSTVSTAHNLLGGLEESRSDRNVVESENSNFGTGIKIRTHQPRNQESAGNVASQGNASRRIHLQKKLQIGPVLCSHETGMNNSKASYEEKPLIDEVKIFPSKFTPILMVIGVSKFCPSLGNCKFFPNIKILEIGNPKIPKNKMKS